MLERSLEIIARHAYKEIFASDWILAAQQMSLPSGRIDLLFQDGTGNLHVVELKKGAAAMPVLDQVLGYANDLEHLFPHKSCFAWVLANSIAPSVEAAASVRGVLTKAVGEEMFRRLMERHGLNDAALLGPRMEGRILHGGGSRHGLRLPMDNRTAFLEMPLELARELRQLEMEAFFEIASGGMQTTLWYRGIKLGGVNRKHRGGVIYLSEGVAISHEYEQTIVALGFRRMEKGQAGSRHTHVWWEIPWSRTQEAMQGLHAARRVVDGVFGC